VGFNQENLASGVFCEDWAHFVKFRQRKMIKNCPKTMKIHDRRNKFDCVDGGYAAPSRIYESCSKIWEENASKALQQPMGLFFTLWPAKRQ